MKSTKSFIVLFLIFALLLGLTSGCSMIPEKKLESNGLTIMFKSKSAGGSDLANLRLRQVQLSQDQVHQQLRSLSYEELSLFGKKKPVFKREEITRMERLVTKAINRAPANKIVFFDLDTSSGTTAGVVFASGNELNWKFTSIQGKNFSNRSLVGWGGGNWRLLPGPRQHYHSVKKLLGSEAQENWIKATIPKNSERQLQVDPAPKPTRAKRKSRRANPAPTQRQAPSSSVNPELEKKLQFLKDLYEKNLVDEEEYNNKRKELLDTYL